MSSSSSPSTPTQQGTKNSPQTSAPSASPLLPTVISSHWYFNDELRYKHVQQYLLSYQLFCGSASAALAKSLVAPIERVKILMQLSGMKSTLKGNPMYKSMFSYFGWIVKHEGWLGLMKGNWANVVRVLPTYGLKLTFNEQFKNIVRLPGQENKDFTFYQLMMAGSASGLFQISITYPLEIVRTRMSLADGDAAYKGILDCFSKMVKSEGWGSLYKGIGPTWLSGIPYTGIQMTSFELVKRSLPSQFHQINPHSNKSESNVWGQLIAGSCSGLISQSLMFPGDTIRRRMQTNGLNGAPRLYRNSIDCVKQTWRNEGVMGFMKGATTNLWRSVPASAFTFAIYDSVKSVFGIRVE